MRRIKVVLGFGLALAVVMAISAGSASATWNLCVNVGKGSGKFENSKCAKEGGEKEWEWQGVTGKDKVKLLNPAGEKLTLEETAEKVKIECTGSGEGTVGPGNEDLVSKITASGCNFAGKEHGPCEEAKPVTASAVHLPWKTELKLISGAVWDLITSDGSGEPGWDVECTVAGIFKVSNTCVGEAQTKMKNAASSGVVEGVFEGAASGKANCENSIGTKHAEAGLVKGTTLTEAEGGNALKYCEP